MAVDPETVFLELTILLSVSVASHFVIRRFRQPTLIGEIGLGLLLGPSVAVPLLQRLGVLAPGATGLFTDDIIRIFAGLGSIFLLFLIGLETDVRKIYQTKNIVVAVGGVVIPWIGGFVVAFYMVPDASLHVLPPPSQPIPRFVMATFVGATLVATSTAIAAALLRELGMLKTDVANTIMGAVIVDDILGLLVLSISLGTVGGAINFLSIAYLVGVAIAFILLALYVGRRYFARLIVWTQIHGLKVGLPHAGFMTALAVAFFTSFLAEVIGLSAVIGAFLAGAMFANTPLRSDFQEGVEFLGAVFTPVFFISLGLFVNVWTVGNLLGFGLVLIGVAFATKLIGCGLAARAMGMSGPESLAVGYGMVPRGEVGLLIALVALAANVIGPDLFSVVVLVTVAISVLPAPLLRKSLVTLKRREAARPASALASGDEPA